jgi:hypothetical protein
MLVVIAELVEHTSREKFEHEGHLVAFPALDLLALLTGMNEKTVRRAMGGLAEVGLVRIQHRLNQSSLYYLLTPPDAENHLRHCDLMIARRRRARQERRSQVSGSGGQMGVAADTKCPTTSDYTSDYTAIPKGHDLGNRVVSKDQYSDFRLVEEKRVGEKVSGGEAELYRIARQSFGGESGASVIAKALTKGGMSRAEVWQVMADEIDAGNIGDAQALAYALSPSWSNW